jgi:tetratricopeptide (TPR) repeat protein
VTTSALDALFRTLREARDAQAAQRAEHAIWQRWMESGDPQIDAQMLRGVQAMAQRDYRTAFAAFDAIVSAAPGFAEGWNKRATVRWLLGDHAASLRDIDRTLALEPRHFGALSGLGMIMRSMGEKQKALTAFKRALEVDPHLDSVKDTVSTLEKELGKDI